MNKKVERIRGISLNDLKRMSIDEANKFMNPTKPFTLSESLIFRRWLIYDLKIMDANGKLR